MQIHPTRNDLFLVEPTEVTAASPPARIAEVIGPLKQIVDWARSYLCEAHPELGREGPVCPYVQASMRKRSFFLTVQRGREHTPADVERTVKDLRDWFLQLEPSRGPQRIYKTILCLFPDLAKTDVPILIDQVQDRLKAEYVPLGVMVGEFHDGPPDKAGLWNPDFRPLAAPVPMLVIRYMVSTDFPFLANDPTFMKHYLDLFGGEVPAHLRADVAAAAARHGLDFPDPRELPHVHRRVRRALEDHGVSVEVHQHRDLDGPIHSPGDFADALGVGIERVTKTLFLRSQRHQYVVLVAPVTTRVNLQAVAEAVGCRRLGMADREELAAYLDYSPGGVSPIGVDPEIPVLVDAALLRQPSIFVAAGEIGVEVEIDPGELLRMTGAKPFGEVPRTAGRPVTEVAGG